MKRSDPEADLANEGRAYTLLCNVHFDTVKNKNIKMKMLFKMDLFHIKVLKKTLAMNSGLYFMVENVKKYHFVPFDSCGNSNGPRLYSCLMKKPFEFQNSSLEQTKVFSLSQPEIEFMEFGGSLNFCWNFDNSSHQSVLDIIAKEGH